MANAEHYSDALLFSNTTDPQQTGTDSAKTQYLVYFLPGNPCLIQFYKAFLQALHALLSNHIEASNRWVRVDVLGLTLPGFECGPIGNSDARRRYQKMPLGIDGQLDFVEGFLQHHAGPNTKVILMGHSLGAYLIMEILQRHQIPSTLTSYSVIGAVGLFPAVVHLAQSEGGKQALRLLNFPFLPLIATLFVRALCILPAVLLQYLIILFFGYPEDAATFTVRWLKSPWGFSESIFLLREELERITADAWDDNVWGSGVHLLFGASDSYVSNTYRDALILARTGRDGRKVEKLEHKPNTLIAPCMELAAAGIPHDFSISHSAPVAEYAASCVLQIIARAEA